MQANIALSVRAVNWFDYRFYGWLCTIRKKESDA